MTILDVPSAVNRLGSLVAADPGAAGKGILSHGWTDPRYVHFYRGRNSV